MKKIVAFMIGLLFIIGCAKNSNDTKPITQNDTKPITQHDDSNSIVISKPKEKEQTVNNFEKSSTLGNDDQIKFEEKSTLGRGDHIDVKKIVKVGPNHSQYERLKGKPVLVTIGWISKSQDGVYRYYEPETNELNPMFTDTNLDILKGKIKSHYSK